MYGPYVIYKEKKVQSYLMTFLDDHSRFPTGSDFACEQDTTAVDKITKLALKTYGIPGVLYLDNGKVFTRELLVLAGAKLGFSVIHPKPNDPAPRGKIERFFRTVRDNFLDEYIARLNGKTPTLMELQKAYREWLEIYTHRIHSITKQSPHDRYMSGLSQITIRKKSSEEIDFAFLLCEERGVSKDSLVSVFNIKYETPGEYIRKKVMLLMDQNTKRVWINDPKLEKPLEIFPVDRHRNAVLPYRRNKKEEQEG